MHNRYNGRVYKLHHHHHRSKDNIKRHWFTNLGGIWHTAMCVHSMYTFARQRTCEKMNVNSFELNVGRNECCRERNNFLWLSCHKKYGDVRSAEYWSSDFLISTWYDCVIWSDYITGFMIYFTTCREREHKHIVHSTHILPYEISM